MQLNKQSMLFLSMIFAALLLAVVALAAGPSGNTASAQAVTPTPTPDNSLVRVQENGRLVVGTSLPYEPFEYYTGLFKRSLDGFDIAVMEEIADRMGVEVQFKDYAFEGLFGALQLQKLDAAIAAITVTSERAERVDFSQIYFRTAGAALTAADSPLVTIDAATDLTGQRIGVQRGTLYESWLRENVVLAGVSSSANIYTYKNMDTAVKDLRADRLDLVLTDLPVAENYVAEGGVRLVAVSDFRQSYAIALPKGATTLQTQFDLILEQMKGDGTLDRIAAAYNLNPLPPLDPGCINDLTFVADVTYPDQNMAAPPEVPANQSFVKTWRVENSGTCPWDSDYRLVYAYGNSSYARMSGRPTPVAGPVEPGESYEISVNLIAPFASGTYQGVWQMEDSRGVPFGEKIYVGITVPAPVPPTPGPTQTPAPGISFTVDRTDIKEGECVTFKWDVTNVREVYFYPDGEPWQRHGVAGQASAVECPPRTTPYNLRVVRQDGSVETRQITILVEQTAQAPRIDRFTAEPGQLVVGQCTNLRWQVSGNIDQVKILANNRAIWDGAPVGVEPFRDAEDALNRLNLGLIRLQFCYPVSLPGHLSLPPCDNAALIFAMSSSGTGTPRS